MASSGHWEVSKSGKQYYCMVSGGYVMVGVRQNDSKNGFQLSDSENCPLESFATSNLPKFLKQNLGDKSLNEVQDKVNNLIAQRNKKTAAPAKES